MIIKNTHILRYEFDFGREILSLIFLTGNHTGNSK